MLSDLPPRITFHEYESSGAFRVEFTGAANHLYVIQGSTDLVHWSDLISSDLKPVATEGSPGYFNFRHSSPEPQRFYRVRQP